MLKDFVVFILSHGRANNVKTLKTLKHCGYTGDYYIVIDDEDKTASEYLSTYSDRVLMFSKSEIAKTFDECDNFDKRGVIVYARNACFELAKKLGKRYFLELDDDYKAFLYRYIKNGKLCSYSIKNIDNVFLAFIEFLKNTPTKSIAFSQGGDLIGGVENQRLKQGLLRKAMNSFFCDTEKPFKFIGRVNEDVNTYCLLGTQGELFFTFVDVSLNQMQTQKNKGGMTGEYLDSGTYIKTFYTIITNPSCVKIAMMGDKHYRIHHNVDWESCTPKILNERWKK